MSVHAAGFDDSPVIWRDLSDLPSGGGGVEDGQILYDDDHLVSLDAGERELYGPDGATKVFSWANNIFTWAIKSYWSPIESLVGHNRVVIDGNGIGMVLADDTSSPWSLGEGGISADALFNNSGDGNDNIDLLNRKLFASDGTTEMLNWNTFNALKIGTKIEINPSSGTMYIDQISNEDGDALANIDLLNRKLYAPDGTTMLVDYSGASGAVVVFPDADPHVDGAAYWVAGVLTRSNG